MKGKWKWKEKEWFELTREEAWAMERPSMKKFREINEYLNDHAYPGCPFSFTVIIDKSNNHAYVDDYPLVVPEAFKEVAAMILDCAIDCKYFEKGSWLHGPTKISATIDEIMGSSEKDLFSIWNPTLLKIWYSLQAAYNEGGKDDIILAFYDDDAEYGVVKTINGSDQEAVDKYVNCFNTGEEDLAYSETEDYILARELNDVGMIKDYCKERR